MLHRLMRQTENLCVVGIYFQSESACSPFRICLLPLPQTVDMFGKIQYGSYSEKAIWMLSATPKTNNIGNRIQVLGASLLTSDSLLVIDGKQLMAGEPSYL